MKIIDPLAIHTVFEELPTIRSRHLLYLIDEVNPPALDTEIYRSLKKFRWQPTNNVNEQLPRPLHLIFVAQQTASISEQLLTAQIDWSCQSELPEKTSPLLVSLAILRIMAKANDNDEFCLLVVNNLSAAIASQLFVSGALTIDGLTKFLAIGNDDLSPYRSDLQKIGRKKIAKLICHPLPQKNSLNEYLSPVTTTKEISTLLNNYCFKADIPNYDRYREDELIDMALRL